VSDYAIAQLPTETSSYDEMSASLTVVPEDVGHETAEFRVRTVMAIRVRGKDRFPRVQFHGELQAPSGFDSLVTVGISLNGPIAIWSSRDGEAELHARYEQPPGGASFPRTTPGTTPAAALAAYAGSDVVPTTVVQVRALPVAHPHVDVLADGSFLAVGAHCSWTQSGPEPNALAIDQNGRIFRRGCLGDGIAHLQVAGDGTIWAGYFDEGVFGNLGWGGPGPTPLGAGGIAAWSPDFEKIWELDPEEGLVADCYALNVGPGEVLACPYTDFPVVRIQDRQETVTTTSGVSGPAGIIASGDQVGLIGTYRDPSLLITGAIQDGAFHESKRANLLAPDGAPLPMAQVHCRGSVAHFFAGGKWYSFDLESVA
jgi:hypothetical protein